ncbi:P-loop containing nucleoside triphosphate hydrolase protein [Rickenella mellea]|uniref:RNA helicase n=1 Tax=Rickenella mellea TaxID=50990 RepID=A0A4Y7Q4J5_9AGAM|nr:P-loop containing nucleoside triphosphate hydrolase protein [Rickenella mellea]
MGHLRERFNAKARQSSVHRKKTKHHSNGTEKDTVQDVNAETLVPKTKEQKEEDRRERVKQEILRQSESKFTSKKKKRLEKYIDKKLKKEERVHIFEKLAQTQAELPSTLHLQSSATLGSGKPLTNEARLAREEDKELRRALDGQRKGKRRKFNDYSVISTNADESMSDDDDTMRGDPESINDGEREMHSETRHDSPTILDEPETVISVQSLHEIGSGLKRNADGTQVAPRVVRRKTKGKQTAFPRWEGTKLQSAQEGQSSEDSASSFDSSESSDSDSDENDENMDDPDDDDDSATEAAHSSADDDDEQPVIIGKRNRGGFKDWALKQLSAVKDYVPPPRSSDTTDEPQLELHSQKESRQSGQNTVKKRDKPSEMRGPLGEDFVVPTTFLSNHADGSSVTTNGSVDGHASGKRKQFVAVHRSPEVQEARLMLPIISEEQPIVETVLLNPVVIICGETGSGKTTQVPQFLYEAGFGSPGSDNPGMIGITQPRRVAAMSMAGRVATELSLTSLTVSYQIRYDATVSPSTAIKFMTDGVLLRELATDFLLNKYSVIIIDEAHERSVNTDILIGVLSRVLKLREDMWRDGKENIKPLRLIIMSATLRVSDFAENRSLFHIPPPIINVSSRQHPVTIHFNRRTSSDYVTEAIKKASKIHSRLPPGGILIFMTGQNEITGVCRKLEARFGQKAIDAKRKRRMKKTEGFNVRNNASQFDDETTTIVPTQADVEVEEIELGHQGQDELALDVDDVMGELDAEALDSEEEDAAMDAELGIFSDECDVPMHILPLYSLLPSDKQIQVFRSPPDGTRLVVVATNVAETSLTIPGIRYVIDSGRAKERKFDILTGVQQFQVSWISKASAAQRAGRAGRTGPGHCYRLFSSAIFEHHFDQFAVPEILRMPIEGVVLQMKSMHIDAIVNFPFPTPPDRENLRNAETLLTYLGALDPTSYVPTLSLPKASGHITAVGNSMALFPLAPRFSKMLVNGQQHGCLPYVITIVSVMSVGDPFVREESLEQSEDISERNDDAPERSFLNSAKLKEKDLNRRLRRDFFQSLERHSKLGGGTSDVFRALSVTGAYEYAGGGREFCGEHFVRPKAMEEVHQLRAQITRIVQTYISNVDTGFVSNIEPPDPLQLKVLRQLLCSAFIDKVAVRKDLVDQSTKSGVKYATSKGIPYKALGILDDVYIHPSSVLFNGPPPEYLVFQEVVQSTCLWMKVLTVINPAWLSKLGKGTLCTFSKAKNAAGERMLIPRFGPASWELPPIKDYQPR